MTAAKHALCLDELDVLPEAGAPAGDREAPDLGPEQATERDSLARRVCEAPPFDELLFDGEGDFACPPPRAFLIPGLLPAEIPALLFAEGGMSKSQASIALAIAGAAKRPLGDFRPARHFRTLFVVAEESREEVLRRVVAQAKAMGVRPDQLRGMLDLIDACDVPGGATLDDAAAEAIIARARSFGAALLVVDPLFAFRPLEADEEGRSSWTETGRGIVAIARYVAARGGATVLLVHHAAKSGSALGSTLLRDGARFAATMRPLQTTELEGLSIRSPGREWVVLEAVKSNYAPLAKVLFRRGELGVLLPQPWARVSELEPGDQIGLYLEAGERVSQTELCRRLGIRSRKTEARARALTVMDEWVRRGWGARDGTSFRRFDGPEEEML